MAADVAAPLLEMRGITKAFLGTVVLEGVDLDCRGGRGPRRGGRERGRQVDAHEGAGRRPPPRRRRDRHRRRAPQLPPPGAGPGRGVASSTRSSTSSPSAPWPRTCGSAASPAGWGWSTGRWRPTRSACSASSASGRSPPAPWSATLSVAQQQVVEVVKARSLDARILVMDEPTAALAGDEVEELLALVRRLRERGLGILYISHRLREVFAVADRITVLKDGRRVDTVAAADTTPGELVTRMVGRELDAYFAARAAPEELGDVRLAVRGGGQRARCAGIDLEVRAGEIVGVAGLQGAGRTELVRALFGADPFTAGTVEVDGAPRRLRLAAAGIAAGIGFLTEDRKDEGLALGQSVRDNTLLALPVRCRPGAERRSGPAASRRLAPPTELRARSLEQEVRYLSGGNQQKVVLAKWLALEPGVMLFDEPTRGVDVGAKAAIHELMRELARQGPRS